MCLGRSASLIAAVLLLGLMSRPAAAQPVLSNVSVQLGAGNSADQYSVPRAGGPSYERQSGVMLQSGCTANCTDPIRARYSALVNADNDSTYVSTEEDLQSAYSIHFQVVAQGPYRLRVDSHMSGDLNLVADDIGAGQSSAMIGDVTGSQSGGELVRGSLNLGTEARAGKASGASSPCNGETSCAIDIDASASARIRGDTRGGTVDYTLQFAWTQHGKTVAYVTPEFSYFGKEGAVRLGGTGQNPRETASDYPGSPARTQALDGHFVTIQLIPANDECPDATVIPAIGGTSFEDSQDTSGADSVLYSSVVPVFDPSASCGNPTALRGGHSVWYRFNAPTTGLLTASTRGSDYDTVLSVRDGDCSQSTQLACGNDASAADKSSRVSLTAIAGKTYYILVTAYGNSSGGTLKFSLKFAPPTPTVTVTRTSTATSTATATRTATATPTATVTWTPTGMSTPIATATAIVTATPTAAVSWTPTSTSTPAATATVTVPATVTGSPGTPTGYDLSWHTIDAGGGRLAGGNFQLSATTGQPDVGTMGASGVVLDGGFWAGAVVLPLATPTGSATVTRTPSPAHTATPTNHAPTPSVPPTGASTPTAMAGGTATRTATPTGGATPSRTPTGTVPPTATPTATPIQTAVPTLPTSLPANSTSIPVADINVFPDHGTILIEGEVVTYDGKRAAVRALRLTEAAAPQPGELLEVQRGVNGTLPAAHPAGASMVLVSECVGNCSGDDMVSVNEIVIMVNIALGNDVLYHCEAGDSSHDGRIAVNEIIGAVNNALGGCPSR